MPLPSWPLLLCPPTGELPASSGDTDIGTTISERGDRATEQGCADRGGGIAVDSSTVANLTIGVVAPTVGGAAEKSASKVVPRLE